MWSVLALVHVQVSRAALECRPASQPIAMPPSEAMRPAPHERSGYPAERPPAQPPNWPPLRGPSDLEPRGAPPPRQDAYARAPLGPDPRWSPHEPLRTAPPAGRGYYGDPYASEPAPRGALVRPPPDQVEGPPSRFADDPRYADGYGRQMPPPSYRLGPEVRLAGVGTSLVCAAISG